MNPLLNQYIVTFLLAVFGPEILSTILIKVYTGGASHPTQPRPIPVYMNMAYKLIAFYLYAILLLQILVLLYHMSRGTELIQSRYVKLHNTYGIFAISVLKLVLLYIIGLKKIG